MKIPTDCRRLTVAIPKREGAALTTLKPLPRFPLRFKKTELPASEVLW